jgi:hypothetical protein
MYPAGFPVPGAGFLGLMAADDELQALCARVRQALAASSSARITSRAILDVSEQRLVESRQLRELRKRDAAERRARRASRRERLPRA